MKVSQNSTTDRIGIQITGELFDRNGYIFREQPIRDCGIDAQIELIENENATGKLIALQIKSGPSWLKEEKEDSYIFRGDSDHLQYWLDHSLPVLILLCDVDNRISYWQAITPGNVEYTEKGWKVAVPKYQTINPGMIVDLKRLVQKLEVYKSWTITSIKDVSHSVAKRYSLKIVLNKEHTQAEIIELIKSISAEVRNSDYYRSDQTKSHWRENPAHVVWLIIYPTSEDESNNNYLCQTEWFSETIDPNFLPSSNGGEEIAPNLRVLWNTNYLTFSRYYNQNVISKTMFIQSSIQLTGQIMPFVEYANQLLKAYIDNKIEFETLKDNLTAEYPRMTDLYHLGADLGPVPYECKDSSIKFQSLIAHAHNIYIYFSGVGEEAIPNQVIYNIKSQSEYFFETLNGFEFELKKIR